MTQHSLALVAHTAQRSLGRAHVWATLRERTPLIVVAGGLAAFLRPFVWALHDASPSRAVIRTALLFGGAAAIVIVGVSILAWRKRPSLLASIRTVDDALGLAEVVASGFAFERDKRTDEMAKRAIDLANEATRGVDIASVLAKMPGAQARPPRRFLRHAIAIGLLGLGVGAIDRLVVDRTLHPITTRESTATSDLKRAAEAAAADQQRNKETDVPKNPKADEVVEAAKRAAAAAERGDRKRAAEALEDMRKAQRAMEADDRAQAKSLKDLRDEIESKGGTAKRDGADTKDSKQSAGGRPSATAGEALEKTKRDLEAAAKSKDPEELRKLTERLAKAEASARAAAESAKERAGKEGGKSSPSSSTESAWSRAAAALKEAREAAARGDAEAAKRAMERAEKEIAAIEKAREMGAKSGAMAKLGDHASELDRSMHAAVSGDKSMAAGDKGDKGDGDGDGKDGKGGKGSAVAKGGKPGSKGDPSGLPGGGPGEGDRKPSADEQKRVKMNGSLQARTDVREGERAAGVIQGMGKGGDPRAYKEVFPSYDSVVEEGLRDDSVPAARRPTVRRYFSSIRPEAADSDPASDSEESKKKKP